MFKPFGVTTSGKAEKRQRQTSSESEKSLRKASMCLSALCEQVMSLCYSEGGREQHCLHKALARGFPLSAASKQISPVLCTGQTALLSCQDSSNVSIEPYFLLCNLPFTPLSLIPLLPALSLQMESLWKQKLCCTMSFFTAWHRRYPSYQNF